MENKTTVLKTRGEILNAYHNKHLNDAISHMINLGLFASLDDKTIVAQIPSKMPDGTMMLRKVKVGDARMQSFEELENIIALLVVIEALLLTEGEAYAVPESASAARLKAFVEEMRPTLKKSKAVEPDAQ